MKHVVVAVVAAAVGLGCTHQLVTQRDGCWIRYRENRWGDTHEEIAACRPVTPKWSSDPLVRSIEACMYQEQVARYDAAARSGGKPDPSAAAPRSMERCLEHAQKLALERIDGLKRRIAAAEERATRLADENRELRGTILACVEKQPNVVAEAHATTESKSDSATTSTEEETREVDRRGGVKRSRRTQEPKPIPTNVGPGCPTPAAVTR